MRVSCYNHDMHSVDEFKFNPFTFTLFVLAVVLLLTLVSVVFLIAIPFKLYDWIRS